MNSFFQYPFTVSRIVFCAKVLPQFSSSRHRNRQNHGLVYKLQGTTEYIFASGRRIPLPEGHLLYLPKFSDYDVGNLASGLCYAVNFELSDPNVTFEPFTLSERKSEKYESLFVDMTQNYGSGMPGSDALCFSLLYKMLSDIQKDRFRRYSSTDQITLAENGADFMKKRLSDPTLTVREVSAFFDVSEGYFRRIFLQVYGISPRRYLILRRMARAKELLLTAPLSCREIAAQCGFDSESYFSKEFRRHTGKSASDFRKSF